MGWGGVMGSEAWEGAMGSTHKGRAGTRRSKALQHRWTESAGAGCDQLGWPRGTRRSSRRRREWEAGQEQQKRRDLEAGRNRQRQGELEAGLTSGDEETWMLGGTSKGVRAWEQKEISESIITGWGEQISEPRGWREQHSTSSSSLYQS